MRRILFILALLACTLSPTLWGQRRITPINNQATATQHVNENFNPDSLARASLVEMRDAMGRTILVDTITGTEFVDSTALNIVPKMEYPLAYAATVGVNVWDPLMRLFGQKYGVVEFSAEFNMHNRYIAVVDVGIGAAKDTPDDNNYTYHSKMAPYFRVGLNYNFLYNSSPAYMAMAGVRYGFSPFTFYLTDVTVDSPYWQEDAPMSVPSQRITVGYLQLLFNLRVKIAGPLYLGWTFIFHKILHESKAPYGRPWYIPGYGSRDMPVTGAFTVTYNFELKHNKKRKTKSFEPFNSNIDASDIDSLPELKPGDDPTRVPHFHPEENPDQGPDTGENPGSPEGDNSDMPDGPETSTELTL